LIDETPASVCIDREKLSRLKTLVKTNRSIVTWLYTATPQPNVTGPSMALASRLDRAKLMVITYYLMPKKIKSMTGKGYWRYCFDLWGTQAASPIGRVKLVFKKLAIRGPVLLYRLLLGR
jgi:hypothetical protein